MGSHMQLLLEALRAHLRNNGGSDMQSFTEDDVGLFTGLFLEDLRNDTFFTFNNMDREINPLVELLYGEDKSQFQINRLQDHLARIEMKVQQLESRVPHNTEQNIMVAAAEVDAEVDDDEYEDDESDETSKKKNSEKSQTTASGTSSEDSKSKGSTQKKSGQKGKDKQGKCGDEGEKRNCFARLLFSKCWSGNQGRNAGWNAICCNKPGKVRKGGCPAYSTCPCGDDAPCAKIERKPCPANENKGGKGGGKGKSGGGGKGKSSGQDKSSGKGKSSGGGSKGNSKDNKEKCEKKKKDENPLSALCEKFCNSPCIFGNRKGGEGEESKSAWRCGSCNRKKHVHTPCCCRCKDNPALEEKKKKTKGNQKHSEQKTKASGKQESAKKAEPKRQEPPKKEEKQRKSSASSDEYEDAEETSVHSAIILSRMEDKDPTQEPIRCVGCTDCDDIRRASREPKNGTIQEFKGQTKTTFTESISKGEFSKRSKGEIKVVPKQSSTNFQVMLPPSISSESTDHNMVSHQILKTLSTIHGPIRVEQKIVVKGTKNAFVIVTHGEACECNVCSTLKNESITEKNCNGSPKVVRFPTDTGCDTLVNHSDDCQCNLCSVLQQSITEDGPMMNNMNFDGGTVWASWSKNKVQVPSNQSSESVLQESHSKKNDTETFEFNGISMSDGQNGGHSSKKHCHKNREERPKRKKCKCIKCVKRRKVKKLKKRLKHVLGPSISQVIRELSHHGFTVDQDLDDYSRDCDVGDDENTRKPSRTSSKRVSFSRDSKTLIRTVSKESKNLRESQNKSGRRKLLPNAKKDDREQERKDNSNNGFISKLLKKSQNRTSSPHSNNSSVVNKPCDCIVCNSKDSENTSQVADKSKMLHHRSSEEEEQKCFPEKSKASKCGCKKDTSVSESLEAQKELLNKVTHPDDDFIRPPTTCEPSCTGRCRFITPHDELNHNMRTDRVTPVVLQASRDKVPPKVLYWIPSSPNLAAAFSSDSYYIPDMDEFPTSDREGTKVIDPNSTAHSSHRNQSQTSSRPQPTSSSRSRGARSLKDTYFH